MNRNTFLITLVTWFAVAAAASEAVAQAAGEPQVSSMGTATITAQPETLRVTVQLQGEGADVKEAVAKLNAEKQAARDKLAKLGAAGEAVTFSEPAVGDAPLNAQQRQMQMIARMQRGAAGAKKPTTAKASVSVSSVMTAELPLKAAGADELLVAATDLQDKLREQFKPKGAGPGASPEEQEVLEEMMSQDSDMMGGGSTKPGEPTFLFVHKVGGEEQQKALADAFGKARESAAQVAKSAGAQLGDVRSVSASSKSTGATDDENNYFAMMATMSGQSPGGTMASEATSSRPGPVACEVTVRASFALK